MQSPALQGFIIMQNDTTLLEEKKRLWSAKWHNCNLSVHKVLKRRTQHMCTHRCRSFLTGSLIKYNFCQAGNYINIVWAAILLRRLMLKRNNWKLSLLIICFCRWLKTSLTLRLSKSSFLKLPWRDILEHLFDPGLVCHKLSFLLIGKLSSTYLYQSYSSIFSSTATFYSILLT